MDKKPALPNAIPPANNTLSPAAAPVIKLRARLSSAFDQAALAAS